MLTFLILFCIWYDGKEKGDPAPLKGIGCLPAVLLIIDIALFKVFFNVDLNQYL